MTNVKKVIEFLGHIIDADGITTDPDLVVNMKAPYCVSELRRFLRMVNQLGKFPPNVAEISQPLKELLSPCNVWHGDQPKSKLSLNPNKNRLSPQSLLCMTLLPKQKFLQMPHHNYGLGDVLPQQSNDGWKPVVYAFWSMTKTEQRYAQMEK